MTKSTLREKLTQIYRIRIWYPRMKEIYEEIVRAYEMNTITAEPECIALLGRFRTGKTTLVESFVVEHPSFLEGERTKVPVLSAVVPAKASNLSLLTVLLAALGDPFADRGTTGAKAYRVDKLIEDCGVQMVILDESNHFVDRDSQRVLHDVSNTMKTLVKTHNIACVLVGLPYTEEVLKVNEQFGSLFGDPYLLEPFDWNENHPDTINDFRMFLHQVETQLPLEERQRLSSREMAWRCYVASYGKVGYLMRLVRRAAEIAVRDDATGLELSHLEKAFDITLAGQRQGLPNPFVGDPPKDAGPEESEYWPVRKQRRKRS